MKAAEAAAAERLAEARGALDAEKRHSNYERELSASALADLQEQFEDLHRQHAELADVHSSSASEIRALQVCLIFHSGKAIFSARLFGTHISSSYYKIAEYKSCTALSVVCWHMQFNSIFEKTLLICSNLRKHTK